MPGPFISVIHKAAWQGSRRVVCQWAPEISQSRFSFGCPAFHFHYSSCLCHFTEIRRCSICAQCAWIKASFKRGAFCESNSGWQHTSNLHSNAYAYKPIIKPQPPSACVLASLCFPDRLTGAINYTQPTTGSAPDRVLVVISLPPYKSLRKVWKPSTYLGDKETRGMKRKSPATLSAQLG